MVFKGSFFHYIQMSNKIHSQGFVRPKLDTSIQPEMVKI